MLQPSDGQDSDKSDDSEQKPTEAGAVGGNPETTVELNQQPSVRRKLKSTFGRWQKGLNKETSKKKKGVWAKFSRRLWRNPECEINSSSVGTRCVCTGYQKTVENPKEVDIVAEPDLAPRTQQTCRRGSLTETQRSSTVSGVDLSRLNTEYFSADDWDERARQERAKEIEEGVEPPPGYRPSRAEINFGEFPLSELTLSLGNNLRITAPYPYLERFGESLGLSRDLFIKICERRTSDSNFFSAVHTQVDYVHCLVPDLLEITNCSFYWGKMDRYEAEKLLENKPEGTFLLRDSAQEEYLFSVSFRRYGRSLHARIEQWNHKFSFDSHDPGVFASSTVCGLIEHYKDPSCCMFFEPMLTIPLHRIFPFSLQHLCRAVICGHINYDGITKLQLPKSLKTYLKEYHYKQRVRVRHFEIDH